MNELHIDARDLTLGELRRVWEAPVQVTLSENRRNAVKAAQATVNAVIESGEQVYGVNTGFRAAGECPHQRR